MNNVGVVLYKKGDEPGTLIADWRHTDYGKGRGVATGGTIHGFEGKYQIQYFDENDLLQTERELEIKKEGDQFNLLWRDKNIITCRGIGFETSIGLVVGFSDI